MTSLRASQLAAWSLTFSVLLSGCAPAPPTATVAPTSRLTQIPLQAVKRTPGTDRYPPRVHDPGWSDPVPLPGPINTAGAEDSPFLSADGQSLLFWFTPDLAIPAEQQVGDKVTGIYLSTAGSGEWGEPVLLELQDRGQPALDGCPFLLGETLWFCSARPGNFRDVDLWTATLRQGVASGWRNAGEQLNRDLQAGEMHLSADGSRMVFHGESETGSGRDLWTTVRVGDGWSAPTALAAVNTPEDEGWPYLTPDGKELWFTRWYQGSPAVYRARWAGADWGPAELIVSSFAGEPTLDPAGNLVFVHHFVEDGKLIEADLYVAYRQAP
jgi:hypothetical protein